MTTTVTLDTNCVLDVLEPGPRPFRAEVTELLRLAQTGMADLALTSAFRHDTDRAEPAVAATRYEWLETAPIVCDLVPGPFMLGWSRLGRDSLVSEVDAATCDSIQEALFPRLVTTKERQQQSDMADVAHVCAHWLARRDLFVTGDRHLLRCATLLSKRFGITVVDPREGLTSL